jgi:purine-binding chemotaxis protein CheW
VQEVLDLDAASIAPPPKIGTKLKTEFIKGMGQAERPLHHHPGH